MKVPLRFQITEYDCGTTSLINALAYLFDREELPVSLLKAIYRYTLDAEGEHGIVGEAGTSRNAVEKLSHWILRYANNNDFNIICKVLEKEEVTEDAIRECLNSKGCVLARCYQDVEHYVLITKMDNNFAYIFDPYYLEEDYYYDDTQVAIVLNENFTHNRIVKINRLFNESKQDFSLMEIEKREVVLLNRKDI